MATQLIARNGSMGTPTAAEKSFFEIDFRKPERFLVGDLAVAEQFQALIEVSLDLLDP